MPYPNTPTKFSSDPGDDEPSSDYSQGTSRYYIYANGMIRVKFMDGKIHVRPGKNICFMAHDNGLAEAARGADHFTYDGNEITFAAAMNLQSAYQDARPGKVPVDFYLAEGRYAGGRHTGHAITKVFNATINGRQVDKDRLDIAIRAIYGTRHSQLAPGDADDDLRDIADRIT
jgi:hypothetical protein